jgi:hypothetical protein
MLHTNFFHIRNVCIYYFNERSLSNIAWAKRELAKYVKLELITLSEADSIRRECKWQKQYIQTSLGI